MATAGFIQVPTSVSIKTASYTIPANTYARAVVNLEGIATFTVNGVLTLRGTENSVMSSMSEYRYTNIPIGTYNGSVVAASGASTSQKPLVQDYWLPTGTVINGTGTFRIVVEEYLY
jgi:hypothetical protein